MAERSLADHMLDASPMQLWRMFLTSKSMLMASILAGAIAGASNAALLALINRSLDERQEDVRTTALTYFGFCLLVILSGTLSLTLSSQMAQKNLYNLRLWLSRRILCAPLHHLQSCGSHRLMAALTEDIGSVVSAQEQFPTIFIEGSKLLATFVYLGFLSPSLLSLVVIFLACGVAGFLLPQKWAWRSLRSARETDDVLFGHFRAITEGSKEFKMDAQRRRAFLDEELRDTANLLRRRRNKVWLIFVLTDRLSQSLYYVLIGAILFLAPLITQTSRETLTGATLTVLFLGAPMAMIIRVIPAMGKGLIALRNIQEMGLGMAAEPEVGEHAELAPHAGSPETLELLGVSHRYKSEEGASGYALGPVDLRIEPGELVFVTGGNGSGKTTLAMLILGLYAPESGEIRLGGQSITRELRDAYRQSFSAVFADAYVFDTLSGYSDADLRNRVESLLVLLQLDQKLRIDNGRLSTIELSRGQRKRLALLAAYVADRPFYLFDEWAAEQDPIFREIFYREMLPELKARGKTVIVITHDDRYFHLCDRLLRLTMGRIEEIGPSLVVRDPRCAEDAPHA